LWAQEAVVIDPGCFGDYTGMAFFIYSDINIQEEANGF